MWKRLPTYVRRVLMLTLLGACGVQIARLALASPPTQPVEKDVRRSERVATSRVGGEDVRSPLPAGSGYIGGNGVVEPSQRETKVAAQVTAIVHRVLIHEGEHVKAGTPLIELSQSVERAAVRAAEAELTGERASLARARKGMREEEQEVLAAELQAAQASFEMSAGILARTEQLARSGAATPDELERARRQARTDEAQLASSRARLRAAASSRQEDLVIATARVSAAEARLEQARAAHELRTIRAPLDAEVLQIKVREGELFSHQGEEPLLIMGDTRRLRVRMDVDERDIAQVRKGASAYVMADAFGDLRFNGRVLELGRRFGRKNVRTDDPVEKNDTKILEVVLELDSQEQLLPGQRVRCFVSTATDSKVSGL
jgi:multidrug resistance efflux pump